MDNDNIQEGGGDVYGGFEDAFRLGGFDHQGPEFGLTKLIQEQLSSVNSDNARHILFLRHGISEANESNKFNKIFDSAAHPVLTPEGRIQAESFGHDKLPDILEKGVDGQPFDNVEFYSSALPRACETIQLISDGLIKYLKTKEAVMDPIAPFPTSKPPVPKTGVGAPPLETRVSGGGYGGDDGINLSLVLEKTITRINGISELPVKVRLYGEIKSSQRSISEQEALIFMEYLNEVNGGLEFNKYIENSPSGKHAIVDNLVNEITLSGKGLKRKQYMTTDETFKQFVENMHKIFVEKPGKKTLHIVVGHGMLMMDKLAVGSVIKNHAYLDEYNRDNQDFFDALFQVSDEEAELNPLQRYILNDDEWKFKEFDNAEESHSEETNRDEWEIIEGETDMEGGAAWLKERKENKQRKKDIEKNISDEAIKYILKIFNMKRTWKKSREELVEELFKIIQFSGKEGIEITEPINHKLYVNPDAVSDLIEQFKKFVDLLDSEFKKLYTKKEHYIEANKGYVDKIREGVETEAGKIKPPNLGAICVTLCELHRIKMMNDICPELLNGDLYDSDLVWPMVQTLYVEKAGDEWLHNEIVDAKQRGEKYKEWLKNLRSNDYENEFETKIRKNENYHAMWQKITSESQKTHKYTRQNNEPDFGKIDKQLEKTLNDPFVLMLVTRKSIEKKRRASITGNELIEEYLIKLSDSPMSSLMPSPFDKLLMHFREHKQYYGERLLDPKNNNFWNLYLLCFCTEAEFVTPSTKAFNHDVRRTYDAYHRNRLEDGELSEMGRIVENVGKKNILGQQKHNNRDMARAVLDSISAKKQALIDSRLGEDLSVQSDVLDSVRDDFQGLVERENKINELSNSWGKFRRGLRRGRNHVSRSLRKFKKKLTGSGEGKSRKRKNKRNKKKTHKKSIKRKPKTNKRTKKKHKKHSRRP